MPPIRDWASLAPDLVELIGWRRALAGDQQDYVRFRAVCSHWSESTIRPHIRDPCFHPRRWMMLPEGHGLYPGHPDLRGFVRFLNLSTGALVHAHLPLLDDHAIIDSVDGLLLLYHDRDTVMRLLHPLTGEVVDLPPLASLLPQMETLQFCPKGPNRRGLLMNPYASVSVSSQGTVTVMLTFTCLDRVAYATDADGFPHFPLLMKIAEYPFDRISIILNLVECGSEVLLLSWEDESCIDLAVYRLADLALRSFAVGRFLPITSTGNSALVIGERCLCVLLSPNKWLPSVSPNSVICARKPQSGPNAGEYVFEQYSLGTGMWTPASDGHIVEMLLPSPHEFTHHIFTCCYRRYWNKGLMFSAGPEPKWLIKQEQRFGQPFRHMV
ncbi:hypothetical protein SORBI_3002G167200 [Sorghum bicolor]|uniref:DUF295 domain-containing protein n=1 Tax=Sorghum bicolor TaxID=4558 RepID=C5X9N7_SORBI|nr:hypothetical protein SORBI_3002G167200 [Sorghum bicolor]